MNILPHKSWHVYNRKNIEKVRKDEAKAEEKEAAKRDRAVKAESEARLQLLRQKADLRLSNAGSSALVKPEPTAHRVRLFEDFEKSTQNEERAAEEKAKDDRWERQVTMYLDKGATDDATPWYAKSNNDKYTDAHLSKPFPSKHDKDGKHKKRKRSPIKSKEDPLEAIRDRLEKKEKRSSHYSSRKQRDKDKKKPSSSSSMEALRAQRLERERAERERTRTVVFGERPVERPSSSRYHSQFNPNETADAKRRPRQT